MKKLILLAFAAILCVACSVEENTDTTEGTNLEVVLENYKGVFTTQDGQTRGALSVELSEDNLYATGSLALSTGEVIAISTDQITEVGNRKEITFTSSDLSFTMTTGEEEEIMVIDAVTFRGAESSILVGQNTERAPLSPIVGSYTCPGCAAPLDNVGSETFNLVIASAGNSTITSQTTLGGTTYIGNATQSGCVSINAEQTTCNLTSGTTSGVIGTAFNPGAGPVTWSGTHTYDDGPSDSSDCSTVSGTWSWASSTLGTVGGVFTSNPTGDCVAPITTLIFEDFEDSTVEYILRDYGDNVDLVEDISEAGAANDDYFGRVALSDLNPANTSYINFGGARFFGAYDTDGISNYSSNSDFMSINWNNLNITGLSTITVAGLFSEAETAWDNTGDFTQFTAQYSFNDGASWSPIFSISTIGSGITQPCGFDPDNNGPGGSYTPQLSNSFTELSDSFSTGGNNTVSIRFIMNHLTGGDESIHFDNITITGI
jgi:hypothetical protein